MNWKDWFNLITDNFWLNKLAHAILSFLLFNLIAGIGWLVLRSDVKWLSVHAAWFGALFFQLGYETSQIEAWLVRGQGGWASDADFWIDTAFDLLADFIGIGLGVWLWI